MKRVMAFRQPPPKFREPVGQVNFQKGSDLVPPEAQALLEERAPFVMRDHELWPAALANFGDADYLRVELARVPCTVLGNTAKRRDFSYYLEGAEGINTNGLGKGMFSAEKLKLADGKWQAPPVKALFMGIDTFLRHRGVDETDEVPLQMPDAKHSMLARAEEVTTKHTCLYLQHNLMERSPDEDNVPTAAGGDRIGGRLKSAIEEDLNVGRLQQLAEHFGPFRKSQLFVGTQATSGARSTLHFDQMENLFLQVKGRKRFRIYAPEEAGNLYAYPVHHPLDRRAQVDLSGAEARDPKQAAAFPRLGTARCREVEVGPGDLFYLPAYYWHEVTTLPSGMTGPDDLTVSVNFWFPVDWETHLYRQPLRSTFLLEAARQLEMLIAEILGSPLRVPPFLHAAGSQMVQVQRAATAVGCTPTHMAAAVVASGLAGLLWPVLEGGRPKDVPHAQWEGLFEFVVWKAILLVGPRGALTFLQDLCDSSRFACIESDNEAPSTRPPAADIIE